ncbi:hypothetical protein BU26DRAFT_583760 [Trematosphaeria pertusa]|uniref:Uncharacterized protein n=1 Tax=Trematosphaeria pertusa TaxID=390896 RepID=A0A6A6IX62_9PLEO|nr:uncharacterized protein BU26DRAFT_583760 [Trematosphaeria pertusa]KAF2255121.1 hypothetical protein BU26DRAFT_583760 [Trematosphaeria pertusa]
MAHFVPTWGFGNIAKQNTPAGKESNSNLIEIRVMKVEPEAIIVKRESDVEEDAVFTKQELNVEDRVADIAIKREPEYNRQAEIERESATPYEEDDLECADEDGDQEMTPAPEEEGDGVAEAEENHLENNDQAGQYHYPFQYHGLPYHLPDPAALGGYLPVRYANYHALAHLAGVPLQHDPVGHWNPRVAYGPLRAYHRDPPARYDDLGFYNAPPVPRPQDPAAAPVGNERERQTTALRDFVGRNVIILAEVQSVDSVENLRGRGFRVRLTNGHAMTLDTADGHSAVGDKTLFWAYAE